MQLNVKTLGVESLLLKSNQIKTKNICLDYYQKQSKITLALWVISYEKDYENSI